MDLISDLCSFSNPRRKIILLHSRRNNYTLYSDANIDNNNVTMLLSLRMQPTINFPFCKQKLTVIYDHLIIGRMEYISVEEAAEITGYSQQYIRRLLRRSKIKAVKKGYMW